MSQRTGPRGGLAALVLGLVMLAAAAVPAAAAPKFPPLTGRVVDDAHMLSPGAVQSLTDQLATLEQQTGRQVVVATVPDLQGYEIEDYGYQLGRFWGVGDKTRNDGVVFLIAPAQRKVRIEVGYGLEPVLTDALSSTIIQAKVLPAFRAGQMETGVVAGTQAIIGQLSLPEDQARQIAASAQPAKSQAGQIDRNHIPVLVILFIAIWLITSVLRGLGGRRGGSGLWWLPFLFFGGGGGGRGGWSGGGGGFSGGGGSFGGGGSSGSW